MLRSTGLSAAWPSEDGRGGEEHRVVTMFADQCDAAERGWFGLFLLQIEIEAAENVLMHSPSRVGAARGAGCANVVFLHPLGDELLLLVGHRHGEPPEEEGTVGSRSDQSKKLALVLRVTGELHRCA